ncbi:eaf0b554-2a99-403a-9e31-ca3e83d52590 [Thermothielavioides terrestris]|uniref:tRNA(Phe) 7-[(3-amino-3-carboxypropyl)-4-demethylwyosine(37)-N(4)]-methyltransferase n=1 Tax=Thermothielavioides terrestris TaxID=2587410 RepID=A0A446BAZ2_9PEZI|nr:eaf0b554-2a99-403a-9e31-ca3e83d52590 [Thermothielavioides terrestris]
MKRLPAPGAAFSLRKQKILSQLSVPDAEYTDASPKGSVDAGIRHLIDEINARPGLVTTSSCAGRVSVYLEGRKKEAGDAADDDPADERRPVAILHILTASPEHAQMVIQAGMQAGFRETGAVSLLKRQADEEATPMVAVRSMGLSFESLIGAETEGVRRLIVSPEYLKTLVRIANERFIENRKRIERFRDALSAAFAPPKGKEHWEDAQARRERKRQEGLKRREELNKPKNTPVYESTVDFMLQPPVL